MINYNFNLVPKYSKQETYSECSWFFEFLFCDSKKLHFLSGVYEIWGEIRHSNTHKDMDAHSCELHYVKKKKTTTFVSIFIGQLKIEFTVGSTLGLVEVFSKRRRAETSKNGSLEQQEENFLQTEDCIWGNFAFIANPVGLRLAASCCLFQFAIKEGNKKSSQQVRPTMDSFSNELLKIVLARRMVTRRDFMPTALIVLRSYCYFLFTNPSIMS